MNYKHAESEGWFYKIDELGNKSASFNDGKPGTSAAGFFKEMQEWEAAGGIIESQYTAEELVEKESADLAAALATQKATCRGYLDSTDYKLLSDFEYPLDVPDLLILRAEWKRILKSGVLEAVPTSPF